MTISKSLIRFFALFISSSPLWVLAQSSSDSPYSDQNFDPANPVWYETPLLWVGLVLILVILAVWMMKVRRDTDNQS